MNDYDLRDLTLAGVRWELTDAPFVSTSARAVTSPAESAPVRTMTSIVPPIAPTQTISVETAAAMAARPSDIDALCRMISEFNHPLRAAATNVVLPHIATNPNGMIIVTDIPGPDDDATGRILSGAAGELLDKMLSAIGMTRDNVSIVPLVFWRTPGGRTPTRPELDLARPFVNRVIELVHPRLILTLGTTAAAEIGGVALPRGHGVAVELPGGMSVMPIFHPNYLMLKPAAKRDAWTALQSVEKMLKTV